MLLRKNKGKAAVTYRHDSKTEKKTRVSKNYMGKNPMTRTQWRRFQRQRKAEREAAAVGPGHEGTSGTKKEYRVKQKKKAGKELVSRSVVRLPEEETDDFQSDSEDDFDVLVNVVSILPHDFSFTVGEDPDPEYEDSAELEAEEMALYRPTCYFVMNNGSMENQDAFFERPTPAMKNHLKPLLIRAKVEGFAVNKVLVDCGATVNIMPHHMLKKIGRYDTDIRSHNVVLSDYGGKTSNTMGVVQINITVGSVVRLTIFMVIQARPSYNLLLGREWLHGIGAVPSSMHLRLVIWREDGIVENIEADQGYFMAEANAVGQKHFEKKLANIPPCQPAEDTYSNLHEDFVSLKLHETHGIIWDVEPLEDHCYGGIRPTGWGDSKDDHV